LATPLLPIRGGIGDPHRARWRRQARAGSNGRGRVGRLSVIGNAPWFLSATGAAVAFAFARWQVARFSRTIPVPAEAPFAVWNGGLHAPWLDASRCVRLELFGWGVRVRGRWTFRPILPTWEVYYGELTTVQSVRWPVTRLRRSELAGRA
jgi:hypothetical protein